MASEGPVIRAFFDEPTNIDGDLAAIPGVRDQLEPRNRGGPGTYSGKPASRSPCARRSV